MVIDRDPHCNTHRVKEKIHIRLQSNNINRDSRIESPEAWSPLIKKHSNSRSVRQWTSEAKAHTNNAVRNHMHQSQRLIIDQPEQDLGVI